MSEQWEDAQPDDYLDDDAVTDPPDQMEWWRKHKQSGHRVQWNYAGLPICLSCGLIFPNELRVQ